MTTTEHQPTALDTGVDNRARTARTARGTAAVALVVGAGLTVVSILLMPDFSGGHADRLVAIGAAQGTSTVSALAFGISQLFLAVGIVGVAHVLRARVPVLAVAGGTLTVLGIFGHTVYAGVNLVMLSMAQDLAAVDTHVATLSRADEGIAIPFMAAGLLGTVLGLVVLAVALWRGRLGPRWLGPALAGWVVVEFALSGLSPWGSYASGVLYVVVFSTMAVTVVRSSIAHWQTAVEVGAAD